MATWNRGGEKKGEEEEEAIAGREEKRGRKGRGEQWQIKATHKMRLQGNEI